MHTYVGSPYEDEIRQISVFPLWKPLKIKDLTISRGAMQRAYKEMKETNFKGNIIDYLCFAAFRTLISAPLMIVGKDSVVFVMLDEMDGIKADNLVQINNFIGYIILTISITNIYMGAICRMYMKDSNAMTKYMRGLEELKDRNKITENDMEIIIEQTMKLIKKKANELLQLTEEK